MIMVAFSVVLTVVVLNYHHRNLDTHEMPPWVSTFNFLPSLLSQFEKRLLYLNSMIPQLNVDVHSITNSHTFVCVET